MTIKRGTDTGGSGGKWNLGKVGQAVEEGKKRLLGGWQVTESVNFRNENETSIFREILGTRRFNCRPILSLNALE